MIRHVLIRCALLFFCMGPSLGFSYVLPRESAVPGGVKIIPLDYHGNSMPYVDVDGHRAMVVREGADWLAVIGIPLSAPLASRQVVIRGAGGVSGSFSSTNRTPHPCPAAQALYSASNQ